jgi:hypothetical protein
MPNTIDWGDNEVKLLIDERRNRNEEYWFMLGRSKLPFEKTLQRRSKKNLIQMLRRCNVKQSLKGLLRIVM